MQSNNVKSGYARTPHRSLLRSLGLDESDFKKPFIGVCNSFNEIVPGHIHLRTLAEEVKKGILMEGGIPFEFPAIAVCDGIAMNHEGMRYSLPSRELILESVEVMAKAHQFDGLVLIPNCDKTVPAMIMAACRINIPTIIVSGGPMLSGKREDEDIDLVTGFEVVGKYSLNECSEEEMLEVEENACPTCGSCSGMFTANSMNCITEALGISLRGNGTVPAVYSKRKTLARNSGRKIMSLVEKNILPRDIINEKSIKNALTLDMALGCSTNTVLHLTAIAREAHCPIDLKVIDKISSRTPNLCKLSPAGPYHIQELDEAGGIYAVLKELSKKNLIEEDAYTVYEKPIGEMIKSVNKSSNKIIKDVENKINNLQVKINSLSSEIKNSVRNERENFDKKLKDEISKISNTKDRYSSLQTQSRSYTEEIDVEKGWGFRLKFWPHTETKTVHRNETFINIQDSIEQIISFAQDTADRIERTSEKLISKYVIKKAMRDGIIDLFELEDRPKVVSVIDNYIQNISIPEINFDVNKYRDIVLSRYGSSYSQEKDINFIEGLHNKALLTIIEDAEKAFTDVKEKLNSILEEIERNIVDELKEGIEEDLKKLKEQLENQKESIKMTELGIEEVNNCLKMM